MIWLLALLGSFVVIFGILTLQEHTPSYKRRDIAIRERVAYNQTRRELDALYRRIRGQR
jgi:hypothetical protein